MKTTTDRLLNGRVSLQQPAEGYRAAIDPALLAAGVSAKPGQRVLELGCGAGAALFCLAARVPGLDLTGIEVQPELLACAEANAVINAALGTFTIMPGNVQHLDPKVVPHGFDHVFMNPPYHDSAAYDAGEYAGKTMAHAMPSSALMLWVKAAHVRLKHRGGLTVIYRADGLAELLAACAGKFGGLQIMPLWPRADEVAKRVILQGYKDSKAPLRLLPGLILHEGNHYTEAAQAILRDGAGINWSAAA